MDIEEYIGNIANILEGLQDMIQQRGLNLTGQVFVGSVLERMVDHIDETISNGSLYK